MFIKQTQYILLIFLILLTTNCFAERQYTNNEIADAIFKAENSTKHPYGILVKYKTTTPRQACLNTIKNQKKRHAKHNCGKEFLVCLRDRYCPLNALNDPTGLNVNWLKNIRYYLARAK